MESWRFISEAEDAEERCRATIAENAVKLLDGARNLGIEIDPLLLPEQDVAEGGFDPDDELDADWDDAFENARIEVEGCFGEDWTGRKPERIPGFLAELGDLWAKHCPDWRFGQLACNLDRFHRYRNGDADLFYLEEYEFLALMKDFFDTLSPSDRRE